MAIDIAAWVLIAAFFAGLAGAATTIAAALWLIGRTLKRGVDEPRP